MLVTEYQILCINQIMKISDSLDCKLVLCLDVAD